MAEEQTTPKNDGDLPRIRTYAADMSKVIKSRGESLASIVNKEHTAEKKHPSTEVRPPSNTSYRTLLIGIGIGVFALAGVGVLFATLIFSPADTIIPESTALIFANKTIDLSLTDEESFTERLGRVRNEYSFALGEILYTVPTKNGVALPASEVARRLNIPDALAREVTEVMVGLHSFDRNQPFIILRLAAYDRSFAALLGWERMMGRNLGDFFAPLGNSGSNAPLLTFTDTVIQNLDIRSAQSEWPLLYGFPEQRMVIITTNEFTLREIVTRLGSAHVSF